MVLSGSEWLRMVESGSEYFRVAQSGSEWFRVVQSCSEWFSEADLRRRVAGRAGAPPASAVAHLVEKTLAHFVYYKTLCTPLVTHIHARV